MIKYFFNNMINSQQGLKMFKSIIINWILEKFTISEWRPELKELQTFPRLYFHHQINEIFIYLILQ